MLSVNEMKKKVLEAASGYDTSHINIVSDNDLIKLTTSGYKLEITINKKWVGYDFEISKKLTEGVPIGTSLDTDLYPLDYNDEVTSDIFENVVEFVHDLLGDNLYYGKMGKKWVFARPSHQVDKTAWAGKHSSEIGEYILTFYPKGLFGKGIFTTIKKESWSEDRVKKENNLQQLIANGS